MQDFISYANAHGIELSKEGPCQFCGSAVSKGVIECHENVHHLSEVLDFSNPMHFETRFLSVDAMALQHSELHGKWNNHIHLARLFLIFERNVIWDYSKTPLLSNTINAYKKNRSEFLKPPPLQQRGAITTSDLVLVLSERELIEQVRKWATEVFNAFSAHHYTVALLADKYLEKYH